MIEREELDGVVVVRLDHGKVNALDLELTEAITRTFRALDRGPHRAVVLTGAGGAFSAGVDLWRVLDGGADYVRRFVPSLVAAFEAVFEAGLPVVAAVNGHAIAGGCVLVNCCDHRVMADGRAGIGVPELLVGVPFPLAALEIMRFGTGTAQAREAVLSGRIHRPPQALERGFVDEVTEPGRLMDRALAEARRLASAIPADTYRTTKRQLRLEVTDRIARHRADSDAEVIRLWEERAADGRIRDHLAATIGRGGASGRGPGSAGSRERTPGPSQ
jgi:enoyl-CoA hydratase